MRHTLEGHRWLGSTVVALVLAAASHAAPVRLVLEEPSGAWREAWPV